MGVYCSKLSVFSEKLFIPIRFEMLVTKFFQADVYGVESLFACNVRTFIVFYSAHVVCKCACCLQVRIFAMFRCFTCLSVFLSY